MDWARALELLAEKSSNLGDGRWAGRGSGWCRPKDAADPRRTYVRILEYVQVK